MFNGTLNVVIFGGIIYTGRPRILDLGNTLPNVCLRSTVPLILDLGNTLPKLRESMLFSLALDATLPGTVIKKVAKVLVNWVLVVNPGAGNTSVGIYGYLPKKIAASCGYLYLSFD